MMHARRKVFHSFLLAAKNPNTTGESMLSSSLETSDMVLIGVVGVSVGYYVRCSVFMPCLETPP
jgi:hypothetical protein